jgi:hypothetical protein
MFWSNYTRRLTLRIRSVFLLQNYLNLYIFVLLSVQSLHLNSTFTKNSLFWSKVGIYLFTRFSEIVYIPLSYLKQTLIGQNFHRSLHYRYLKEISNASLTPSLYVKTQQFSHYLYFLAIPLIHIPNTSKFIKQLLNQILQHWPNMWVQWPKFYKIKLVFLCTPSWWQLFYFTNIFYFKVYNT